MRGIRALPLSSAEFLRAIQYLVTMTAPRVRWSTLRAPIDLGSVMIVQSLCHSRGSSSHSKAIVLRVHEALYGAAPPGRRSIDHQSIHWTELGHIANLA